MGIVFAPYGSSREFYENNNTSLDAPKYLSALGFNGYEYLANEGVHISDDGCSALKKNANEYNVSLSVRAYDFLRLSDDNDDIRKKSIETLCDTVRIAQLMGAGRVAFSLENCAIRKRAEVLYNTKKSLEEVIFYMNENNINDVLLCPETMGLIHNLGTADEVFDICLLDEHIMPAINVGNLYARGMGQPLSEKYFTSLFDKMKKKLGKYRGEHFHLYLSKVEYTHHGFREDVNFNDCDDINQEFESVFKVIKSGSYSPFVVCKSPKNKEKDLNTLKNIYEIC